MHADARGTPPAAFAMPPQLLFDACPQVREVLPRPSSANDMSLWWEFAKHRKDEWHELVSQLFFTESTLDRQKFENEPDIVKRFTCSICDVAVFASEFL